MYNQENDATLGVTKKINEGKQPRVLRVGNKSQKRKNKERISLPDQWGTIMKVHGNLKYYGDCGALDYPSISDVSYGLQKVSNE